MIRSRGEVPGLTGTDGEDNGDWKKAQNKKMKRVKKSEWKKVSPLLSFVPNRRSKPRVGSLPTTGEVSRVVRGKAGETRTQDEVNLCPVEEEGKMNTIKVDFQVAAVRKPVISVKRICEKGNRVCFGPEDGDNYL